MVASFNADELRAEAVRIGDDLIGRMIENEEGIHWQTINPNTTFSDWHSAEDLYGGVSGIVLFFIELYKHTGDRKYLRIVEGAAEWLIKYCRDRKSTNYAFYTGRMGVAYTLLQVAQTTGLDRYTHAAVEIAEQCDNFLSIPMLIPDLLTGSAGTILGLMHVHRLTGAAWALKKIDVFLENIISSLDYSTEGVKWGRDPGSIKSLCGFSHGAAGIGFVLLELGNYIGNDTLKKFGIEAFNYENQFFNKENKNWPDFRKIFNEEVLKDHKQKLANQELDVFFEPYFMNAWCHGAPGIGLSRIRAFSITGNAEWLLNAQDALKATQLAKQDVTNMYNSYTLCHGHGGNALLFLEAFNTLQEASYLPAAYTTAQEALSTHKKQNYYRSGYRKAVAHEDYGLFMGNAGIGYFYLKLLDYTKTPNILLPYVDKRLADRPVLPASCKNINISSVELNKVMLSRPFPKTTAMLEKLNATEYESFLHEHDTVNLPAFKHFARTVLCGNPAPTRIFETEDLKLSINDNTQSLYYLYVKELLTLEEAKKFLSSKNSDEITGLPICFNPVISLLKNEVDWDIETNSFTKNTRYLILKSTPYGVEEIVINEFCYIIFSAIKEGKMPAEIMDILKAHYHVSSDSDLAYLKEMVSKQVLSGIESGFLIERHDTQR